MKEENIILKATRLRKTFHSPKKTTVLSGVDLQVKRGESVAITGRSGQGKSTLLYILGTLEDPCSGTIEIDGKTVLTQNRSEIRNQHLAFIFQNFHLLEDYTALENVLMPAKIARRNTSKGSEAFRRGCELLETVGLSERLHYHTKLLSGGEKQRVAIARALCNDPDILFADEPSGNLDKQSAKQIHQLLIDFSKRSNKSVVIVTHDPELAGLCDTRYELSNGSLGIV